MRVTRAVFEYGVPPRPTESPPVLEVAQSEGVTGETPGHVWVVAPEGGIPYVVGAAVHGRAVGPMETVGGEGAVRVRQVGVSTPGDHGPDPAVPVPYPRLTRPVNRQTYLNVSVADSVRSRDVLLRVSPKRYTTFITTSAPGAKVRQSEV